MCTVPGPDVSPKALNVLLVGIDCATVDAKVGLALADYRQGEVRICESTLCTRESSAAVRVFEWVRGAQRPALLAIDAPLGWPVPLSRALTSHHAGEGLVASANEMFRRQTDRFIREKLFKTPLDVGADRIARKAHAALRLLADIGHQLGRPIPLAWRPQFLGVVAIEVYPAATLVAHGFRSKGYKKRDQLAERREILVALSGEVDMGSLMTTIEKSADAVDAVVCLLAAKDFLGSRAMPPEDTTLAEREGWIWAAGRGAQQAPEAGLSSDSDRG